MLLRIDNTQATVCGKDVEIFDSRLYAMFLTLALLSPYALPNS